MEIKKAKISAGDSKGESAKICTRSRNICGWMADVSKVATKQCAEKERYVKLTPVVYIHYPLSADDRYTAGPLEVHTLGVASCRPCGKVNFKIITLTGESAKICTALCTVLYSCS